MNDMTSPDPKRLLAAVLRSELKSFLRKSFDTLVTGDPFQGNWHLDAMAHHLELCRRREIRRLIITLPPRSGKSIIASAVFPAWILGHDPTRRVIAASYSSDLAVKLSRDCRTLMQAQWYQELFPKTRLDRSKSGETEFATTRRGGRLATSVGGTLTGRGGNFIVIDDPIKPDEAASKPVRTRTNQWFDNTVFSRMDNKAEDVIIIVTQRTHIDDLVGHVLEKSEAWVHLNLPAIAETRQQIPTGPGRHHLRRPGDLLHPAREPQHILDTIKENLGSALFSAQYQQAPVPEAGNIVKRVWLRTWDSLPQRQNGAHIYQSWDTAQKAGELNDYSVCITAHEKNGILHLAEVFRARLDYPSLKKAVTDEYQRHRPHTLLIEDKGSGTSLCQELPREHRIHPVPVMPEGDKVMRLSAQSSKIEAGRVLLPNGKPAWLGDFVDELLAFPGGRHDDQVDALTQLLAYVGNRPNKTLRIGRIRS